VSSAKRWSMRRTVLRLKLKNFSDRILWSSLVSMAPLPSTSAFLNRSITSGSVPGGKRASYSYRDGPDPQHKSRYGMHGENMLERDPISET
jgi:hypothetical protein